MSSGVRPDARPALRASHRAALVLAALGVVYGDIGTSPLYTVQTAFTGVHPILPDQSSVLGVLSLIFWALMIVVSLKYVVFIMRADNNGEGGIVALLALVLRTAKEGSRRRWLWSVLALFGAALFYGDGIITPAISVLSAVEGLEVGAPGLKSYVIPITLAILIALFLFQRRGTATVGRLFGPIMIVWFVVLAVLGIRGIIMNPAVLGAIDPQHAVRFFVEHRWGGFLALGAVVLAVTGVEALYADMGHFGKGPIRLAWFGLVLPALVLNYFGQGALVLQDPHAVASPFYLLAPPWALYPLVALATLATVIASQAVISGAYSLTRQAMQLGYTPRFETQHTSEREIGQIYIPGINWALLIAVVGLVLAFRSSSDLAAAYGIAVTGTMVITTVLAFTVVRHLWGWGWVRSGIVIAFFLSVDLAFFSANLAKIVDGGWFPLALGIVIFTLLSTWKRGRQILFERLGDGAISLEAFLGSIAAEPPLRVPGTAVFLTQNRRGIPHALLHNLAHNKVLHERVVFLTVITVDVPYVPEDERSALQELGQGFYRITLRNGFKETPDVPRALEQCAGDACQPFGLRFNILETSFFLSRETLLATSRPGMAVWREKLFVWMAKNGSSATAFFKIPTNRVVELGTQVEL